MFAVIKTGGKQLRVAANDIITVAKLDAAPGDVVTFGEVVMFTNDNRTELGAPAVSGVSVAGEVVEQTRGKKVIAFKKRRRQNSRRKRGHRQDYTVVRITEIVTGGAEPSRREPASAAASGPPEAEGAAPAKKPRSTRTRAKAAEGGEPAVE
jgi:large subunit ribosomal protein L21